MIIILEVDHMFVGTGSAFVVFRDGKWRRTLRSPHKGAEFTKGEAVQLVLDESTDEISWPKSTKVA